jgi:hypothetical protein
MAVVTLHSDHSSLSFAQSAATRLIGRCTQLVLQSNAGPMQGKQQARDGVEYGTVLPNALSEAGPTGCTVTTILAAPRVTQISRLLIFLAITALP